MAESGKGGMILKRAGRRVYLSWRERENVSKRRREKKRVRSSFRDEAEALSPPRGNTIVCLFGCGDGLSEAVTRRSLSDGLR